MKSLYLKRKNLYFCTNGLEIYLESELQNIRKIQVQSVNVLPNLNISALNLSKFIMYNHKVWSI